jgi:hypothetical protein
MEYPHPLLATLTVLVLAIPLAHEARDRCAFTVSATECALPQPEPTDAEDRQPDRALIAPPVAEVTPPPVMPFRNDSALPIILQWWQAEPSAGEPPLPLLAVRDASKPT